MNTSAELSIVALLALCVLVVIYRLSKNLKNAQLLKRMTGVMASEINIYFLEKKIIEILSSELNLGPANFVLVSDFVARPMAVLSAKDDNHAKFAPLEKMLHRIKLLTIAKKITDPVDKETFRNLGIELILPLIVGDEDIGLLVIGPKKTGGHYSSSDLKFLQALSPLAAMAIKNADSYRKIQEFSQTLETKVIERTHQLEAAQAIELKLKDEFVFIATHDLATPVTAISGFVSMIGSSQEQISPTLKSYLSAISEASDRLKVLVNDLLQVARSDSGTIKVQLTALDASKILDAAVREISGVAKAKNVQLIVSLGADNMLQADAVKLAEIFENLLSNGVKYNKAGGSITITSRVEGDQLILEFKDTGIGIPKSEQPKIFTKFFRSETGEARQQPGTGLGLFVARMLTQKMGGSISFESIENQGTTFKLSFHR